MKYPNTYITKKFKIRKSNKPSYNYFPKSKEELQDLLKQLIKERGNEGDFNDIDTSEITDMSYLFGTLEEFNGDISNWVVSNVTDMDSMFYGCQSFNQDISGWDVSNVIYMQYMFQGCESFNQDISNWNVSKVKSKSNIFYNCAIEEKYKQKFN